MSVEDNNLQSALNNLKKIEAGSAQSFSKEYTIPTLVKQNNTIIELLVLLHKKIDALIASDNRQKQPDLGEAITRLTTKVQELKLSPNTEEKTVIKPTPKVFAVWTDPRQQVDEYRKKYGTPKATS